MAALNTTLETIGKNTGTQIRVLDEIDRGQKAVHETLRASFSHNARRYAWLMAATVTGTVVTAGGLALVVYYLARFTPAG